MNREAQAIVLLLLGGALVHASVTDLYLRYVKAGLQPLLFATGVVLVLAAIVTTYYEWRRPRPTERNPADEIRHAEPGHAHREPWVSWLLLLPLLALILVAPPPLGSYSATNTGTGLRKPFFLVSLPADGPLQLSLVDYASHAVYGQGRGLADRPITLTGFITTSRDGQAYLTRMVLSCCAADAQPVKIGLTGQIPPVLQPDTWFAVTGTYNPKQTTDPINKGPIPFIDVSQADPVSTPPEPYESSIGF
jgi:putative membrane protein